MAKKLLDQLSDALRTEEACLGWRLFKARHNNAYNCSRPSISHLYSDRKRGCCKLIQL